MSGLLKQSVSCFCFFGTAEMRGCLELERSVGVPGIGRFWFLFCCDPGCSAVGVATPADLEMGGIAAAVVESGCNFGREELKALASISNPAASVAVSLVATVCAPALAIDSRIRALV